MICLWSTDCQYVTCSNSFTWTRGHWDGPACDRADWAAFGAPGPWSVQLSCTASGCPHTDLAGPTERCACGKRASPREKQQNFCHFIFYSQFQVPLQSIHRGSLPGSSWMFELPRVEWYTVFAEYDTKGCVHNLQKSKLSAWKSDFKRRNLWAWFVTSHTVWKANSSPVLTIHKCVVESWDSSAHTLEMKSRNILCAAVWEIFAYSYIQEYVPFRDFNLIITHLFCKNQRPEYVCMP